tara:strand:+ start:129 stop:506 length:378 start_codon:yes stop_codon:yes gene_type:complete
MKVSKIDGKGNHLLLECYGGVFDKLNNRGLINNFLKDLPSFLKLTKISDPLVVECGNEDEKGISGIVLMAESHVSIHTYPLKKFAVADVFSCKEFNVDEVISILKEKFKFEKVNSRLVVREYEKN